MAVNTKLMGALEKGKTALAVASAFATVAVTEANSVLCKIDLTGSTNKVTVTSIPTPETVLGGVLTVIGGVARVAGLLMVIGGAIKFLQAKHEENSAGESKSATGIGIGVAFCVMPSLIKAIIGK